MSWEDIRGWTDGHICALYSEAVRAAKPDDTIIEVGVAYGKSLAYLVQEAAAVGWNGPIIGIDPWARSTWLDDEYLAGRAPFDAMLDELDAHAKDVLPRVSMVGLKSLDGAFHIAAMGVRPFLVFVDAAHTYANVLEDIRAWLPLVKSGGYLAGHDHTPSFPGVERACVEAFGVGGYEVRGSVWVKRV